MASLCKKFHLTFRWNVFYFQCKQLRLILENSPSCALFTSKSFQFRIIGRPKDLPPETKHKYSFERFLLVSWARSTLVISLVSGLPACYTLSLASSPAHHSSIRGEIGLFESILLDWAMFTSVDFGTRMQAWNSAGSSSSVRWHFSFSTICTKRSLAWTSIYLRSISLAPSPHSSTEHKKTPNCFVKLLFQIHLML